MEYSGQVGSQVSPCEVHSLYSMWQCITFVNRYHVRYTVPRVKHDPRSPTRGVQRQDSLDTDIEGRGVEGLKQNLKAWEWRRFVSMERENSCAKRYWRQYFYYPMLISIRNWSKYCNCYYGVVCSTIIFLLLFFFWKYMNWAGPWENVSYVICEQQRRRSDCASSAQSDQRLCCSLLR